LLPGSGATLDYMYTLYSICVSDGRRYATVGLLFFGLQFRVQLFGTKFEEGLFRVSLNVKWVYENNIRNSFTGLLLPQRMDLRQCAGFSVVWCVILS